MVSSDTIFKQVSLRWLALMHIANLKFHQIKIYHMQKLLICQIYLPPNLPTVWYIIANLTREKLSLHLIHPITYIPIRKNHKNFFTWLMGLVQTTEVFTNGMGHHFGHHEMCANTTYGAHMK